MSRQDFKRKLEERIKIQSVINANNALIKAIDGNVEDDGMDESPSVCYALLDELHDMVHIHLQNGEDCSDVAYVLREINGYYRSQTNQMFLTEV